jgi:hypothetical protein
MKKKSPFFLKQKRQYTTRSRSPNPATVMPAKAGIHALQAVPATCQRGVAGWEPKPKISKSFLLPRAGRLFFKKEALPFVNFLQHPA